MHARPGEALPDFLTISPSAEWGLRVPIGRASAYLGAGLSALWMDFGDRGNAEETEIGLSATAEVRRELWTGWSVGAGFGGRRFLLSDPLHRGSLFVTIGRTARVPDRLRAAAAGVPRERFVREPPLEEGEAQDDGGSLLRASGGGETRVDDLRAQGVLRLPEILRALPSFEVTSIDHRAFSVAPAGHPAQLSGAPAVLIDGIPTPVAVFGSAALDRLPLDLEDVAVVEATSVPGLLAGAFRQWGALDLRTRAPDDDALEVHGSVLAENPTGDPGPLAYADSSAANVDKLGTGYAVGAGWRLGGLSGSAGYRYASDLVTDARLNGRTLSLRDPRDGYPVIRTRAAWAALRLDAPGGGRHDLRVGGSDRSDYLFVAPLGSEVIVRSELRHGGAAGSLPLPASLRWSYTLHAARNRLEGVTDEPRLDPDLTITSFGAWTALSLERGPGAVALGAGLDGESAESRLLAEAVETRIVRSQLAGEIALGRARVGMEVELRRARARTESSLGLHAGLPLGDRTVARASGWHVRDPARPLSDPWTLHGHGYAFLGGAGVEVELAGPETPSRETGALLEVETSGLGRGSLDLSAGVRASRHQGMVLAEASFELDGHIPRPAGPVSLFRDARAAVVVGSLAATLRPGRGLSASLRYRWSAVTGADVHARAAWMTVPRHRVRQDVIWSPRADLRIGATADVSSATEWPGYEALGRAAIPAAVTLGASLDKSLWEERVRLQVSLRNLLGHHTPLHPLGAAPGLSLAIGASARLGR